MAPPGKISMAEMEAERQCIGVCLICVFEGCNERYHSHPRKNVMSRCSIWKNSHFKQARTFKNRLIVQFRPKRALRKCSWNADLQFTHFHIHSCSHSANINSVLDMVLRSGITEMTKIRAPALAGGGEPFKLNVLTLLED